MSRTRAKGPLMPYWRAMKAYAYAGKPFEYTLQRLSQMHFETPRPDKAEHSPYLRKYKAVFAGFTAQALRKSKTLEFTSPEIDKSGIDPLYTWIVEGEKGTANDKAAFVQGVIEDLAYVRLRKLVSIGIRLGQSSKEIQALLRRQSPVAWKAYHIDFFRRFFWNVSSMSEEAKQAYLAITLEDRFLDGYEYMKEPDTTDSRMLKHILPKHEDPNEHYRYLKKVLSPGNDDLIRLESYLHYDVKQHPTVVDIYRCVEDHLRQAKLTRNIAQVRRFGYLYVRLRMSEMAGHAMPSAFLISRATEFIKKYGLPVSEKEQPGWFLSEKPEMQLAAGIRNLDRNRFSSYKGAYRTGCDLVLIMGKLTLISYAKKRTERQKRREKAVVDYVARLNRLVSEYNEKAKALEEYRSTTLRLKQSEYRENQRDSVGFRRSDTALTGVPLFAGSDQSGACTKPMTES